MGVIGFYKPQVESIAKNFLDNRNRPYVDVSTVDAFQGDERDVIIITTTRTSVSSFVDSPERINVAISRARRHLFIITNISALLKTKIWSDVFHHAAVSPNKKIVIDSVPSIDWDPFPSE